MAAGERVPILSDSRPEAQGINYGTHNTNVSDGHITSLTRSICCSRRISIVRRTFCLVVTFDLILIFVLWGIHVQVSSNGDLGKEVYNEIVKYDFLTSLVDTVLCSLWRFVPLLIAYALFHLNNPSVVAVTTFGTCIFVVVKAFKFQFYKYDDRLLAYVILVATFVLSWVETFILDFKVLPWERTNWQVLVNQVTTNDIEGRPDERFLTPSGSYSGSDEEDDELSASRARSPRSSVQFLSKEQYQRKARDVWETVWSIFWRRDIPWTEDSHDDNIVVMSHNFDKHGRLFKIKASIAASPSDVFEAVITDCETTPQWNPAVTRCKVLEVLDENTDISINITAPAGAGLVASREFVDLRYWEARDGVLMSAGCAVQHRAAPVNKNYVRGENRLAGWMFCPVPNQPNQCFLYMLVGVNINGWISQSVAERALVGVLVSYIKHLRHHMTSV